MTGDGSIEMCLRCRDTRTVRAIPRKHQLQVPEPFLFVFPHGEKWLSQMTRDELLHVIWYLQGSTEYHKGAAETALRLASLTPNGGGSKS